MDGWDFKQYVLGMLFYRFISENLVSYINAGEQKAGDLDFDYVELDDERALNGRSDIIKEKGFYILPSELFKNVLKWSKDKDNVEGLNKKLADVFRNIEGSAKGTESEDDIRGLFDDLDVNSNKLGGVLLIATKSCASSSGL